MKKETKKLENTIINNVEVETIETRPEDGFVHDKLDQQKCNIMEKIIQCIIKAIQKHLHILQMIQE